MELTPEPNSMSAVWCAARVTEVRAYLNQVAAPDPGWQQARTWLIELLSQLDRPATGAEAERTIRAQEQALTFKRRAETAEAEVANLRKQLVS